MASRSGGDLKKRADELKRSLRQHPAKGRVTLERGAKHTKVMHKDTRKFITTIPDTPSDWRGLKNTIAALKRERVFGDRQAGVGIPGLYDTPSMELVHDGLRVLRVMGWAPNQKGRAGGALREFGKLMKRAAEQMPGVEVNPNPDTYAKVASATLVHGKSATHENLDILDSALDLAFEEMTIPDDIVIPVGTHSGNGDLYAGVMADVEEAISAHDVSELPAVEYAQVGPLHTPADELPDVGDSLFIEVLVAILDKNTAPSRAKELAMRVAKLEGF